METSTNMNYDLVVAHACCVRVNKIIIMILLTTPPPTATTTTTMIGLARAVQEVTNTVPKLKLL